MTDFYVDKLFVSIPSRSEFFRKGYISSLKYPDEQLANTKKLLSVELLTSDDELIVEEVFDDLSHEGFKYLFPKILKAYLQGVFKLDGNFASLFSDSSWGLENGNGRKHGRGKRMDMFSRYRESLSEPNRIVLESILNHLTK